MPGVGIRRAVALLAGVCVLVVGSSVGAVAASSRPPAVSAGRASVLRPARRLPAARRRIQGPPLKDHHGRVLTAAKIYVIWWGDPNAWPADTQPALTDFLSNIGSSPYGQVAHQYMRGAALNMALAGTFVDASPAPTTEPDTLSIANEIAKVLAQSGAAPDPAGVYVVYTATFAHASRAPGYCAWHTNASINGVIIAEAYMPNLTNALGCAVPSFNENQYSATARDLANVTAHEVMESVTDPIPYTGWLDRRRQEIGDKCAWQFPTTSLVGATYWLIQPEWSNGIRTCGLQ